MYDLAHFTLSDMTQCSSVLRKLPTGATSMEQVAERIVRYLYENLQDEHTLQKSCSLVRFFKTRPYGDLDQDCRRFACEALGRAPRSPAMKCLTLMATAGERPDWNDKKNSRRYRAIPLASEQFVAQFPMFSQLLQQFGIKLRTILEPNSDLLMDWETKTYNVFYVPEALGSPFVPMQETFVVPFGIRSVLGFGSILPSGDLFAVILFSKVHISRETADLFKTLTLSAKLAVLPFDGQSVFPKTAALDSTTTPALAEPLAFQLFRSGYSSHPLLHLDAKVRRDAASACGSEPARIGAQARKTGLSLRHEPQWTQSEVETLEELLSVHEQAVVTHDMRRRRTKTALHDSEARLRSVVHSTKIAIISINDQGHIMSWNRVAKAMFGYSSREVLGNPVTRLIPDGFQESRLHELRPTDADGPSNISGSAFESVGRRKDGSTFPVEFSLVSWSTRSRALFTGIIRDITERTRAQEALQKSEHRLRSLVENAHDVILAVSEDGDIMSLNPAFERLTQWACTEWIGRPFAALLHPDDVSTAADILQAIMEKGLPFTFNLRIRSKDYGFITTEFVGTPQTEGAQVTGVLGIARDITERRIMEDALRESEERLRWIVQSTKDAILSIDRDGRIALWNNGAEAMFGYSTGEAIGRPVTLIIPERFRNAHQKGLARASAAGQRFDSRCVLELVGLRKDGTEFPLEFSLASWKTKAGLFFTAIIQDVTERKRTEESLCRGAERFQKQQTALVALTHGHAVRSTDLTTRIRHITETAAQTLGVERVSIWRYSKDRQTIHCADLYEQSSGRHSSGAELHATAYPSYFLALTSHQVIAAHNAHDDPRTREFSTDYLSSLGISSMMDVPIYQFGKLEGVMSHQHVGPSRRWTQDEQMFAVAMSNLISLAYEQWERNRTEEALRKNEEFSRRMMASSRDCIKVLDLEGRLLWINEIGHRVIGLCEPDPVAHTDWIEYWQGHDRDAAKAAVASARAGGVGTFQGCYPTAAEKRKWWDVIVTPMLDAQGHPESLLCVSRDITEQKHREEALRESERALADFFENATVGLHWLGPDGTIQRANKTELDLLGYTGDEYVGHHISEFHADQEVSADILERLSRGETLRNYEARLRCKNGAIRYVLIDSNVYWNNGQFVHTRCFTRDITERRALEIELALREQRLNSFFNAPTAGMFIADAQFRFIQVNEALARIHGMPVKQHLGKAIFEIVPRLAPILEPLFKKVQSMGEPIWNMELSWDTLSEAGTLRYWMVSYFPIMTGIGQPGGIGGIVLDITPRKRAEAERERLAQEKLQLMESMGEGMYGVDRHGRCTFINPAAARMLGYHPGEVLGENMHALVHHSRPDGSLYPPQECRIFAAFRTGQGCHVDNEVLWRKDHTAFPVDYSSYPVVEKGTITGAVVTFTDVTERRQAEAALRLAEERYHSIVENAVEGIFQTTLDGRYVTVNPALARLYGYESPAEMIVTITDIGRQIYVDPHRREEFIRIMQEQGSTTGFESQVYRKDGSVIWISESVRALRNAAGAISGYEGSVENITERKQAQEEVQRTLDRVRTLSRRLEAIREEERTRIARELHDELGTGLTCLKIDLSRLLTNKGDAGNQKGRRRADAKIRSMVEFVDETIRSVQRIVSELRPAVLDDLGLVAAIEWQAQDFESRTGIPCVCSFSHEDLKVEAERATVIFRICQEALTNVARHAAATAVDIRLDAQNGWITLSVRDNGRGISKGKLSDPRSLGLLGMRERAVLLRGNVTISGHPGRGTTVTLHLPNS